MPRPKLKPGQLGKIGYTRTLDGRISGRARTLGPDGKWVRLRARGWTEEAVALALVRSAIRRSDWSVPEFTADSTLAESCQAWLDFDDGEDWALSAEDREILEELVLPELGELLVGEITAARIDRLLSNLLETHGHTAARRARGALSRHLEEAVAVGAIARNPIRAVERLPTLRGRALTPEQFDIVRALLRTWKSPSRRIEDVPEIEDAIEIMKGTSAAITDVLALRRQDVNLAQPNPTLLLPTNSKRGRPAPTSSTEPASTPMTIPASTVHAIERRLENAGNHAEDLLFTTTTGRPYPRNRFELLLRAFATEHRELLGAIEIDADRFDSEVFRPSLHSSR